MPGGKGPISIIDIIVNRMAGAVREDILRA